MSEIHPLFFAKRLAGRLSLLQGALDRLDDLLPHREMSSKARSEWGHLLTDVMHLLIDARNADRSVVSALERRYPGYVRRQRALDEVGAHAYEMENEMEGCPHRCLFATVEHCERDHIVAVYSHIPLCLAAGLASRFPRHFRITPQAKRGDSQPSLPGFSD